MVIDQTFERGEWFSGRKGQTWETLHFLRKSTKRKIKVFNYGFDYISTMFES
jgi:hypothetical protein